MVKKFLVMLAFASGALWAQARLTGSVSDSSGAVVSGAVVSARNIATRQVVPTQTTQTGTYTIPLLNPGEYEIACELSGFKKFRAGSGLILMTTRSGSNEFHGSLYEWLRNEKLDARTSLLLRSESA